MILWFCNLGDLDLGVEDVNWGEDWGYSAVGLRNVSYSIVNIEIGNLPIDSARFDEFAKFDDESFECIRLSGMFRNGSIIVVLIVADDIGEKIDNFFIFLHHFLQKGQEGIIDIAEKVVIQFLVDGYHIFIELFCWIHVQLYIQVFLVYFQLFG